jgi:hypothetical protein
LVRRLILETTPGLVDLGIPAGSGVAAGGWDGTAKSVATSTWVPDGLSVWELSVDGSPGVKADSDYGKRHSTPDGSPTSDCTYIAAILRPWTERAGWASDRSAEAKWKLVKAYGLDDIDLWLEAAPVTWAWFSEVLGLSPYGLRSAETWWDSWSGQTSPRVTAAMVLAGRDQWAEDLRARIAGPGQITTVAGASLDETRAFVAAVGVSLDSNGDGQMLARTAFVDDLATWRGLLETKIPLVLVPVSEGPEVEVPTGSVHHVVVPVSGTTSADIVLPPVDAGGVAEALRAAGMTDQKKADEAGRLGRRSLIALRRHLATKPGLHVPEWAKAPVSRLVRTCLLAGSWSEASEDDKQAVGELAGTSYELARESLAEVAHAEDPLVLRLTSTWHLVSPYDAWLLLRAHVTEDDLKRLDALVEHVLGEDDPSLDLPVEDRWKANLHGKVRSFSADLRRGVGKTLALLGTHGDSVVGPAGTTGSNWATYLVRKLLDAANGEVGATR